MNIITCTMLLFQLWGSVWCHELRQERLSIKDVLKDPRLIDTLKEHEIEQLKNEIPPEEQIITRALKKISEYALPPSEALQLQRDLETLQLIKNDLHRRTQPDIAMQEVDEGLQDSLEFTHQNRNYVKSALLVNLDILIKAIGYAHHPELMHLKETIEKLPAGEIGSIIPDLQKSLVQFLRDALISLDKNNTPLNDVAQQLKDIDKAFTHIQYMCKRFGYAFDIKGNAASFALIEKSIKNIYEHFFNQYTYKTAQTNQILSNFFNALQLLKKYYPDYVYQLLQESLQKIALEKFLDIYTALESIESKRKHANFVLLLKSAQQLKEFFNQKGKNYVVSTMKAKEMAAYKRFNHDLAKSIQTLQENIEHGSFDANDFTLIRNLNFMLDALDYSFLSPAHIEMLDKRYIDATAKIISLTQTVLQKRLENIKHVLTESAYIEIFDTWAHDINIYAQELQKQNQYRQQTSKVFLIQQSEINVLIEQAQKEKLMIFEDRAQYEIRKSKRMNPYGYMVMRTFYNLYKATTDLITRKKLAQQAKTFYNTYIQGKLEYNHSFLHEDERRECTRLLNIYLPTLGIKERPVMRKE